MSWTVLTFGKHKGRTLPQQGKGLVYIEIGKRIFYDPADMDNFINQQKRDGDK